MENYLGSAAKFDLRQTEGVFRGENGEWQMQFAITSARSRHKKLAELVAEIFHQSSRAVARDNARLQYAEASPAPRTSLDAHLAEFDRAWDDMERQWRDTLTTLEQEKFGALSTPNDREAFRVIRNWSRHDSASDFPIATESLAKRLRVTVQTACNIRTHFCPLGILRQTADYIPHKAAARFQWLPKTLSRRVAQIRAKAKPQQEKQK